MDFSKEEKQIFLQGLNFILKQKGLKASPKIRELAEKINVNLSEEELETSKEEKQILLQGLNVIVKQGGLNTSPKVRELAEKIDATLPDSEDNQEE